MKYIDMHCDSITVCSDSGGDMRAFNGQVNIEKLLGSGCAAQCFAIFTEGENSAEDFKRFSAFYNASVNGQNLVRAERAGDILRAEKEGKVAALLTVENLGFLKGDVEGGVKKLEESGVVMASLVWNYENRFAYPNLIFSGGVPDFSLRESRGLKEEGKRAVEALEKSGIIIDLSHLSDGGVEDVLALTKAPPVASHSNCAEVCNVSRNLNDGQLKKIADRGGVAGLNFCRDFIGREDAFEGLYLHLKHMIDVGGEELPALGSDFDGIPAYEELCDCTRTPALLNYFSDRGIPARVVEKVAYKNFMRVFTAVRG